MRVTAIESIKDGVMRKYGEGELDENQIPDIHPFNEMGIHNPCIKLDNGKYVWGFECWWGETKRFNEKYNETVIKEIIEVEPDNIQPVND